MDTAARATSSSASASSSSSNGTCLRERQKLTTPRVIEPTRSGTVISEWMPYSTTWAERSLSCACQPGASSSRGSRTARPVARLRPCGDDSTNRIWWSLG